MPFCAECQTFLFFGEIKYVVQREYGPLFVLCSGHVTPILLDLQKEEMPSSPAQVILYEVEKPYGFVDFLVVVHGNYERMWQIAAFSQEECMRKYPHAGERIFL